MAIEAITILVNVRQLINTIINTITVIIVNTIVLIGYFLFLYACCNLKTVKKKYVQYIFVL